LTIFFLSLSRVGKDQKVSPCFKFHELGTGNWCLWLLVPAQTLVVSLAILTALQLETGAWSCDIALQWQGISVLLLQLSNVCILLLKCWPKRHVKFSKSLLDILEQLLKRDRSFPLSPNLSFRKSICSSSPSYTFYIFRWPYAGLTQKSLFIYKYLYLFIYLYLWC